MKNDWSLNFPPRINRRAGWLLVLFLVGCIFYSGQSGASVPGITPEVNISLSLPGTSGQFEKALYAGETASGKVTIENRSDNAVEIDYIDVTHFSYDDNKDAESTVNGRILKSDMGQIYVDSMVEERKELFAEDSADYGILFEIPEEDGVYEDVITIYWNFAGATQGNDIQKAVYYQVENGSLTYLSFEQYEALVQPTRKLVGLRDGKAVTVFGQEGFVGNTSVDQKRPRMDKTSAVDDSPILFDAKAFGEVPSQYVDDRDAMPATKAETATLSLSYCVKLTYTDNFQTIPSNTTGMKWWRPYGSGAHNFLGVKVELWDRDWGDADDYITSGYLYYSADGNYTCLSFNWDQSNEAYPDVYVRTYYDVQDTEFSDSNKRLGLFCDDGCSCNVKYYIQWRDGYLGDLGSSSSSGYQDLNFGTATSGTNARAMQMAALQKFLRTWRSQYMTSNINVKWVDEGIPQTLSASCIQLSRIYDWDGTELEMYRRWDAATHEAGHAYQEQLMGTSPSGSYPAGDHRGYCSYTDYSAALEGWAEFVSTRTWYPSSKSTSRPIYPTSNYTYEVEVGGYTFPSGLSPMHANCGSWKCSSLDCDCYSRNEIMALRAFWDLWDDSADNLDTASVTQSWQDIAEVWTLYPSGTGNAQRSEYNTNLRDYHHNSQQISSDAYNDVYTVWKSGQTSMICQAWP